ncbi:MAG: recombinase RecA [Planctomycetes bacterium]|nr:recombinase RecA [Planctomycetota bacterium]
MARSDRERPAESGPGRNAEALQDALASIEKSYGKGSVMRLGDGMLVPIEGISTGSLGLDLAVGGRGFPRGRVVEIFGPESSGKTTLALHVVASAQRGGGMAAFIDAEHALDPQYAKRLGVDLDALLISQPDHGEQALDICETLARSGALDVIVIDSVAALVPRAEIEGEMGDSFVGLQARLMSQALRKLTGVVHKTGTMLIFINQIREKIGVMFGSPETTTGGRALKFYASVRIDVRRIGTVKGGTGEEATGARTKATVVKNKIAPPFRKVEFDILFNEGINELGEILDIGVDCGILKRSGTWLSYGDERLGQGRERAREFLVEHPDLRDQIRAQILAKLAPHLTQGSGTQGSGAQGNGSAEGAAQTPSGGGRTPVAPLPRPAVARGGSRLAASGDGAGRDGSGRDTDASVDSDPEAVAEAGGPGPGRGRTGGGRSGRGGGSAGGGSAGGGDD